MPISIIATEANSWRIIKALRAEGKKVTKTISPDGTKVILDVRDTLRSKIRSILKLN